jgi:hypothetical protein
VSVSFVRSVNESWKLIDELLRRLISNQLRPAFSSAGHEFFFSFYYYKAAEDL